MIDKPDHWPGCDIIIGGSNHIHIFSVSLPGVSRIRRFGIDRFNDIVRPVKRLIPDQLNLDRTVPQLFNHENSNILLLVTVKGCAKCYGMDISVNIVRNRNVVNIIITVKIQVIDGGFLIIQASLKRFQCLRLLEEIHHGIKVQIVSRQTKIFIGIVLGSNSRSCCDKECCY